MAFKVTLANDRFGRVIRYSEGVLCGLRDLMRWRGLKSRLRRYLTLMEN